MFPAVLFAAQQHHDFLPVTADKANIFREQMEYHAAQAIRAGFVAVACDRLTRPGTFRLAIDNNAQRDLARQDRL